MSPSERMASFLRDRGWTEVPRPPTRLVLWADPLRPERDPMWIHEAHRVQKRREEAVRRIMES